jgi:hypothetical protein
MVKKLLTLLGSVFVLVSLGRIIISLVTITDMSSYAKGILSGNIIILVLGMNFLGIARRMKS